ncbi:hypothetical protein SJDPG12_03210 [Porphyromonas gingivalis SJD12]|nr:hypothetical protein SJDPG12_03210 [Porphyromonas gingivalis SJD12]
MYVRTNLFDLFLRKVFFRKVNTWQIFVDCLGLFAKGAIQKTRTGNAPIVARIP